LPVSDTNSEFKNASPSTDYYGHNSRKAGPSTEFRDPKALAVRILASGLYFARMLDSGFDLIIWLETAATQV
jgi:hypothetical protein